MNQGDKVIIRGGSGYEIAYVSKVINQNAAIVVIQSGTLFGMVFELHIDDIWPYDESSITALSSIFGYEKRFSQTF
jgi:hypothetical protein